jgi:hypothetical protein
MQRGLSVGGGGIYIYTEQYPMQISKLQYCKLFLWFMVQTHQLVPCWKYWVEESSSSNLLPPPLQCTYWWCTQVWCCNKVWLYRHIQCFFSQLVHVESSSLSLLIVENSSNCTQDFQGLQFVHFLVKVKLITFVAMHIILWTLCKSAQRSTII